MTSRYAQGSCVLEFPMPRIKDDVLECSVYLYTSGEAAISGKGSAGSGFLVSVPSEAIPDGQHVYAVTAAHVIDNGACVIRMTSRNVEMSLVSTPDDSWIRHPEGDDVAAAMLDLDSGAEECKSVPTESSFVTQDHITRLDIGLGDDVFLVGRLVNHEGKQRNLPSVRSGNIAMMPNEPIHVSARNFDQESFVVECRSIAGFSGSPVFVHIPPSSLPPETEMNQTSFKYEGHWLLGVDWGHVNDYEAIQKNTGESSPKPEHNVETGMLGVVPAWKILELLDHPKFVEMRKEQDVEAQEQIAKGGTSVD